MIVPTATLTKLVLNFHSKFMRDERLDGILLVVTALLLCATSVGAFLLADIYHVSPLWVFFAFNSVGLVVILIKDFRGQVRRPKFVAYLAVWAVVHGLLIVGLIHWRVPFAVRHSQ